MTTATHHRRIVPEAGSLGDAVRQGVRVSGRRSGVQLALGPGLPSVSSAQAAFVTDAVARLLRNALRFSPSGSVRVGARPRGTGAFVVWVSDAGPGIAEGVVPMEGLPAVHHAGLRALAERAQGLGGRLSAEGLPGHGTVVWIELEEAHDETPATVAHPLAGRHLLVVDDNAVNLAVIEGIMSRFECVCDTATNGRLAIERFMAGDYDAVLMDLQMPVMDGWAASRWIREHGGERRHTPIVAVSANCDRADRARSAQVGMDDHLPKPIDGGRVADVLVELLTRGHA